MSFVNTTGENIIDPISTLNPPGTTSTVSADSSSDIVVCDGSAYDHSKPYLFIALANHTVLPLPGQTEELGFDASCGRMFSTVSLHDRCGAIVSSEKHAAALKDLGYPVVLWGQKIAFPMCPKAIKRMGVGKYLGAVAVHTFTEPVSCHCKMNIDTSTIVGDGTYDGCNHLAGTYIPIALAFKAATKGSTLVNCETKHSGTELQTHNLQLIVSTSATSICCKDNTGGSIMEDGKVIKCDNAVDDTMPLVVTSKQVVPGFDDLIKEMSGSKTSFSAKIDSCISSNICKGVFEQHDKRLEADIRLFASKRTEIGTKSVSTDTETVPKEEAEHSIDLSQLSNHLQKEYVTSAMVAMKQPGPIGSPIVVTSTSDQSGEDTTKPSDASEAAEYGDNFMTMSYTLEPAHRMTAGENIHKFFGIVAVAHALFLAQIPSQTAYDICAPFADKDSPFLDCNNKACTCNANAATPSSSNLCSTGSLSSKFENMLLGVSQNIALASKIQTGRMPTTIVRQPKAITPSPKVGKDVACKATVAFCGTCRCEECVGHTKLLNLARHISSATHNYQKCDNYVADQTMCAVNVKGVPQYKSTESMLPFGTAMKAIMMKSGPTEKDPVQVRVGMNTDDCENCAFQSKAVMDTLTTGSKCVSGEYFHGSKDGSTYNSAIDDETIRSMRLGSLPKQEQRHILLTAQVVGKMVKAHLAYFVTGSASKANDTKDTKASAGSDRYATNNCTTGVNHTKMAANLSSVAGGGVGAFGSKPLGHRVGRDVSTDAEAGGGLSGHCSCTLNITRSDGSLRSVVVEGTAPVRMAPADIPGVINHRGTLAAEINDDTKIAGSAGHWKGPFAIDNAVDVSMKALVPSHVATISNRLQVKGSTMRAEMILGEALHIKGNMESFYNSLVSMGCFQCVELNGKGGIQPGADVKTFVAQKVQPIIEADDAAKGESHVVEKMGDATCALIRTLDTNNAEYKTFEANSGRFRQTMSPLRLSIEHQDRHMLNSLGSLESLKVNFPDDEKLTLAYGPLSYISHVTHVPSDDSVEGHAKICKHIDNHAKQMNSEYTNVRIAKSVIVGSGEIVTHYKLYGVTDGL